jgi:Beta-lactamase
VYGVSNLDEEIYFHGGGPNVVGDPSSGEVSPDSIMWLCSQTKLITSVSSSSRLIASFPGLIHQLAALKLVEKGKITFDTPVADYLPEFRNPIIVDRTDTQKTSFKSAETVVTLKHLLTFTSGLFYPDTATMEGYTSKEMHLSEDPISEFFRIVIVRLFFLDNF